MVVVMSEFLFRLAVGTEVREGEGEGGTMNLQCHSPNLTFDCSCSSTHLPLQPFIRLP